MTIVLPRFGHAAVRPGRNPASAAVPMAILWLGVVLVVALLAGKAIWGAANPAYLALVREDGVLETSESLLYLAAAILALVAALRLRRSEPVVAGLYGIAAAGMIVIAGEEISWGQRLLGIASPEFFRDNNRQAELNLHNLGPVQVILDYAYLAAGAAGGFGWLVVAAIGALVRGRPDRPRHLLKWLLLAVVACGVLGVAAGVVLTPERAVTAGLLSATDGTAEDLQRRIDHLGEYRIAAAVFGAMLAAAALVALWHRAWLTAFLGRHGARIATFAIPSWHFVGFFLPLFLYYLAEVVAASRVETTGLWGFVVLADEEAVEFLMSLGVALFFLTRLQLVRRTPAPERR